MKKRTTKILSLAIAVLLIGIIAVGCAPAAPAAPAGGGAAAPAGDAPAGGGGAAAPAGGGGAAAPAPAPEDTGQTWNIDISVTLGEMISPAWADNFRQIEERSGGRISTTVHWSQALLPIPEIPRGIMTGVAQFSNLPSPNYVDILPLNTRILQLPYMGLRDPVISAEIYMQLFNEFPEMREEMAQFNMLPIAATTLGVYDLFLVDMNEVRVPADMSGRVIVPYKLEFLPLLEAYGASGTNIPPGQLFENLERGVVDGYVNNWSFMGWFGFTDLLHQAVRLDDYGAFQEFNILVINTDFYNEMPQDLRDIWHDVFWNERGFERMWGDTIAVAEREIANAEERAARGDFLFVDLTPEERAMWRDALYGTHASTLDDINSIRGDTVATDIYNRAREIIAERLG